MPLPNLAAVTWNEPAGNPLVAPPHGHWLVGDPTVLTPPQSPDGLWHMFANCVGSILHYQSDDGLTWRQVGDKLWKGWRAFVWHENDTYYLFYELHSRFYRRSCVVVRQSRDLRLWTEPQTLIEPQYDWDGSLLRFVGNPCLVRTEQGYRLYYSTNCIVLADTAVTEPKYIGMAEATDILGPYTRHPVPLLGPDPHDRWRNRGAGSIKVYPRADGGWWALNNGIYKDSFGKSGSAIRLLTSDDGLCFAVVHDDPIVYPEPGWKQAFVYAFDLVEHAGETRLYFNARDGWLRGREAIGYVRAERSDQTS